MAVKQLSVVRINHDYDAHLLDELVQEAIKPFCGIFEYNGVREGIEEFQFDSPLVSIGVYPWVVDNLARYLQRRYGNEDMLAITPNLIGLDGRRLFPTDGYGPKGVSFLFTHADYLNPSDPKNFIKYGAKIAAHELGHSAFGLEHHELETIVDNGYCLMYLKTLEDKRKVMDQQSMKFCEDCYHKISQTEVPN